MKQSVGQAAGFYQANSCSLLSKKTSLLAVLTDCLICIFGNLPILMI